MELKNLKENRNIIDKVVEGSIAEELDIEPGDILVSINQSKVKDIIDYKYLISDDFVLVTIEKKNGELWDLEIEKEYDEDLGIVFTNPLIDEARSCRNKCIFCFIDQLPKGMRETLYFKDDDSRLSFLQGNFITLTNLNDDEIQRIIDYRLSPINVSVHTTNPELRAKMINNKRAGEILNILKKFSKAKIEVNCQIVLVPGVNDGEELRRTLNDLSKLCPSVKSVAVVPVGITKYREGLPDIQVYNDNNANELLDLVDEMQNEFLKKLNTRFVFASDEFYAITGKKLPDYDEYEGFPQYENGVGMMRLFSYEIDEELKNIKGEIKVNKEYIITTGTLAYKFMKSISDKIMNKINGLNLKVAPIKNDFFGHSITVSGLVTGQDLINQLRSYNAAEAIIIPKSMFKKGEEIFLDNITKEDVEKELNKKVIPSDISGKEVIDILKEE